MSRHAAARGTSQATVSNLVKPESRRLSWWWKAPLSALLLAGILAIMVSTIAFGATRPNTGNPPGARGFGVQQLAQRAAHLPLVAPPDLTPAPDLPELDAQIAAIEAKYNVTLGITITSVAGVYQRQQATWYGGMLRGGDALATIDVPMAVAILDQERQPQQRDYMFNKALADDSAAGDEALWAFLGTPEQPRARPPKCCVTTPIIGRPCLRRVSAATAAHPIWQPNGRWTSSRN